jgi:hypothetical protein
VDEQGKLSPLTPAFTFVAFGFSRPAAALRRRLALFAALLAAWGGVCHSAAAQQPKPEEYQVKAVYLYNFGRFVEWPANLPPQETFDICVMGRDPFGSFLDATLAGESINSRKLAAKRIGSGRDAANCKILFISASENGRIKDILAAVEKTAVLTVSDMPGFTSNGGMIQFVLRDNKVRFEVNLTATDKAGLTLSSQLLKVATDVRKESSGETVKP